MTVHLFEDPRVAQLYPITVGRAAFAITCGSARLVDQALALGCPVRAIVRAHLRPALEIDFPQLHASAGQAAETKPAAHAAQGDLFVNARVVPSASARREMARLLADPQPGIARRGDAIVAARLPANSPQPPADVDVGAVVGYLDEAGLPEFETSLALIEYPHDVIRHHLLTFGENLAERLQAGGFRELSDGVFAAEGATLGEHCVTDTSKGPVLIDAGASIGPYCYLRGPAYIGAGARVIEHSAIKDCVSLGHTTKIGGEVEASIIEPYTNKQHHGFLGHSYLGSWINLGAGTCNSDLKNTYGHVKMEYRSGKVDTGMQFVGAMVGDYAKTAINTGIFTGKTIGVCSMVYGFVTTNVPSFVNYARLFGQTTATPVEVMVATQTRMFARRQVAQRPCDIQLLHDMYDLTRHERELGSVPPEPLNL